MKKIFAIALALVMVLSMASAFASPCTSGFSWVKDAAADACGKIDIEVIPYVKVNTNCAPYYDYEVSTCAAAVAEEKVYYAVKAVIDEDLDLEWFEAMTAIEVDLSGMKEADYELADIDLDAVDYDGDELTLYYNFNGYWDVEDKDFDFGVANLQFATVENPSKAKVCVGFTSEEDDFEAGIIGDYFVRVEYLDETGKVGAMLVVDADDQEKVATGLVNSIFAGLDQNGLTGAAFPVANAVGYIFVDGEVAVVGKLNDKCSTSFFNTVTSFFGIELGTKMDKELVDDNFGWEDEVESCFAWSKAASAIVDAECVVAIPKTGDASVLAWLF